MPLVSVRNEFDFMMELEAEHGQAKSRRRFLLRNRFRIPVGWEAIELFPPYHTDVWNPDLASDWAESDLLGAVLQRNIRDNQFHAIDPNAAARKQMAKLIAECESLLDGNEEPLHQFIKANPELLCPTHYQVWSKLSLGKRDTDFVFREPSGDYLLVELEKPSHLLFRVDGQQREELTHAIDQVTDWRRYIEDNLRTVQQELGLDGISSNPSCLIVIGRIVVARGGGQAKAQRASKFRAEIKNRDLRRSARQRKSGGRKYSKPLVVCWARNRSLPASVNPSIRGNLAYSPTSPLVIKTADWTIDLGPEGRDGGSETSMYKRASLFTGGSNLSGWSTRKGTMANDHRTLKHRKPRPPGKERRQATRQSKPVDHPFRGYPIGFRD
jgi:hypothetical protein